MSYDVDEQENLDNIKAWWDENGKLITNIITVVLIGFSAYFGYKWWKNQQENKAYSLVAQIGSAIDNQKISDVENLAHKLQKDYPNSTHTAIGILRASDALSKKDANKSIKLLEQVAKNSDQGAYATLASYRLAGLLIDNKKYDEAVNALSNAPNIVWQGLFTDRMGDAYIAKGDAVKAKQSYTQALKIAKDSKNSALESFVQLKMNINNSTN